MKPQLKIINVKKSFDIRGIPGLHGIDLNYSKAGLYGLQGPSGCGKTTLLKAIAGLETLDSGDIKHNIKNIQIMPRPEEQNLNQTVLELITGHSILQDIGVDTDKAINLAREALMVLEITNEMNKLAKDLSAGQLQRVMLAMSLVNNPDLILMDEPFSILEESTRLQLIEQVKDLILKRGIIAIWVTHQSTLALQFCDEISIMNFGKIVQTGTPQELFLKPNSLFIAKYFGENNVFLCRVSESKVQLPWQEIVLQLPNNPGTSLNGKNVLVIIRPQHLILKSSGQYNCEVISSVFKGSYFVIHCHINNQNFILQSPTKLETSMKIHFDFNSEYLHLLNEV
jgi:ABC-type Fe3+/spermidine/putrescine transport system ATPase subunit